MKSNFVYREILTCIIWEYGEATILKNLSNVRKAVCPIRMFFWVFCFLYRKFCDWYSVPRYRRYFPCPFCKKNSGWSVVTRWKHLHIFTRKSKLSREMDWQRPACHMSTSFAWPHSLFFLLGYIKDVRHSVSTLSKLSGRELLRADWNLKKEYLPGH